MASPARRARETAALLGARDVAIVDALVEMDWGAWEGKTLAALGRDPDFAANEARGLDFQPPGGESPRAVMHRLDQWLATLADGAPIVAVTHKGVMRAALARATCWTMLGKPPVRFDWSRLQRFDWRDGRLSLAEPNLALA
jgi:probable phosphoglycerate mutase